MLYISYMRKLSLQSVVFCVCIFLTIYINNIAIHVKSAYCSLNISTLG